MAEELPTGQRIYDPNLEKERDAFPGEIVSPDQQKTMQRLMARDKAKFDELVLSVSDALSTDEINALRKAGQIAAERARERYLEQIKTDPVTNIKKALEDAAISEPEKQIVETLSKQIMDSVERFKSAFNQQKAIDKAGGSQELSPDVYSENLLKTNPDRGILVSRSFDRRFRKFAEKIINNLGAFPSTEVTNLDQLITTFKAVGDKNGVTYVKGTYTERITGLPALNPGLEGITINIFSDINGRETTIEIRANQDAWARIMQTNL